tara:strand:- start:4969 stop:5577 length:609 start_codon:yes stop_codon:yes gene_type:complete
MGIKANFDSNLKKATQGPLKMEFDRLRKTKSKIREDEDHPGKSCDDAHLDQSHSEWLEGTQQGEMEEATTASSSGQYSTPQIWAKNEKNWRGAAKPQWPGGKFVKVKNKCKTFPYCNQGDINALDLTENVKIKEAIDKVSKKTGKNKEYVKELVKKEIEELIKRGFYKSPVTDPEAGIVGVGKMDTPIGKIYSMGGNKPKYE